MTHSHFRSIAWCLLITALQAYECQAQVPATTKPAESTTPIVEPAKPVKVVEPGTPDKDGKVPEVDKVQEKQHPTPPAVTAPADKPVLSAPAPSPEVLPVLPKTRYFVAVFSSQSMPKRGKYSHTWATFIKATPKPNDTEPYDPHGEQTKHYDLTANTISWLPASLKVRVLKLRPDCGHNFNLDQTLRYVRGNGECVAMWGPYELNPTIAEEVYGKALKQMARLNSGCILYKAIDPDSGPQAGRVVDCIHAVSDLDGLSRRMRYNEFQYFGWAGGQAIVRSLVSANRVDPSVREEWVAAAIGVNRYPVSRQTINICRPATAPVTTTAATSP